MKPRFASSVIDLTSYARQVFQCDVDEWRRLPVQWRGFVLHHQNRGHSAKAVLTILDNGTCRRAYDPQGAFDAFQGMAPA